MKQKRKEKQTAEDSQKPNQKETEMEKSELEELRDTIESLQKEKDEIFSKLQRVSADYANFQKRVLSIPCRMHARRKVWMCLSRASRLSTIKCSIS